MKKQTSYYENDSNTLNKLGTQYYNKAVLLNHSDKIYQSGLHYEYLAPKNEQETTKIKYIKKAMHYYKKAAILGNPYAMYHLGYLYDTNNEYKHLQNPSEAINWYKKAADLGNLDAMVALGSAYLAGNGVNQDGEKAFKLYKKAADLGSSLAMFSLGILYDTGIGTYQDKQKAEKYFTISNENLIGLDSYAEDIEKLITKNYSIAFKYFETAANMGNVSAMSILGFMYENGNGTEKNYQEALIMYKKAAKSGNSTAINNLGHMYEFGHGVEQNYQKAFEYYKQSAKLENPIAMNNLGRIYKCGNGVNQDYIEAFKWYEEAAFFNDLNAMRKVGKFYEYGTGVQRNYQKALEWYKKAFESNTDNISLLSDLGNICDRIGEFYENQFPPNYEKSFYFYNESKNYYTKINDELYDENSLNNLKLGYIYYKLGKILEKSPLEQEKQKSLKFYIEASKLDNSLALSYLGYIYYKGIYVTQNYTKAFSYFTKATDLNENDSTSFYYLGCMYYNGFGVIQDYQKAFSLLEKSANLDNSRAMCKLGYMYYKGYGVTQNYAYAEKYLNMAINLNNKEAFYYLGCLYYETGNYTKAEIHLEEAADAGIIKAMCKLGYIYENGIDRTYKNYELAFEWYEKAYNRGDKSILNKLKEVCKILCNNNHDYEETIFWLTKAIELKIPNATDKLGVIYNQLGTLHAKTPEDELFWFNKAIQLNNAAAMCNLASMYDKGRGVDKDHDKAMYWYTKAAKLGNKYAIDKLNKKRCFITSAVCNKLNKTDNCYELNMFRKFRDSWLMNQPDGKNLIEQYYNIAPIIVKNIDKSKNANKIYFKIWEKYLTLCLHCIETNNYQQCKKIYITMVNRLYNKFYQ